MWSTRARRSRTSPPVTATAARNVALRCGRGSSRASPAGATRRLRPRSSTCPLPRSRAPIAFRRSAKSEISGSRAALSMTVVPFANAAAMRMFSVAPTLGNSSVIGAPLKPIGEAPDVAVLELEGRAERLETGQVHVDRARTEVVASGQRNSRLAAPRKQRTEHADRPAHALDEVIRRLGMELVRRAQRDGGALAFALDSDRAEQPRPSSPRQRCEGRSSARAHRARATSQP